MLAEVQAEPVDTANSFRDNNNVSPSTPLKQTFKCPELTCCSLPFLLTPGKSAIPDHSKSRKPAILNTSSPSCVAASFAASPIPTN